MTDNREQAKEALMALAEDRPPMWPPVAERIRDARRRAGLTEAQVAERAGLTSVSEYWDFELRDDEVFTTISVAELHRIAAALQTTGSQLLFGEQHIAPSAEAADFATIATHLAGRVNTDGISVEALGDSIGWEVAGCLQDPPSLATFNVVGFRDVCRAVGVDWIEAFLLAGSRPPNDELQRTRPAQAMEPRR